MSWRSRQRVTGTFSAAPAEARIDRSAESAFRQIVAGRSPLNGVIIARLVARCLGCARRRTIV
jgi:hypothetical protein